MNNHTPEKNYNREGEKKKGKKPYHVHCVYSQCTPILHSLMELLLIIKY